MTAKRAWRDRAPWRATGAIGAIGAVLSLLLLGGPVDGTRAAAVEPAPSEAPTCERQVVLDAWVTGGPNVRPAAEEALLGDEATLCAFLDELPGLVALDDRQQVGRIKSHGGVEVAAAANVALRSGTLDALRTFLDGGWATARAIDLRARVNQMKSTGGPEVRAAANAVLRNGSPADLEEFVDSGWQLSYNIDLRVTVNRAMATGGPEVRAAANRALRDGSLELLQRFVQIDWGVAQVRDNESQTLNDLRTSATEATRRAALETISAVAQSERAKTESALAKADALEAERLAVAAGRETEAARMYAQRAATAADRASAASSIAVQAARSAADAARAAAGAAGRAATAAARAHTKSDEAWAAAAAAELNADDAANARALNRLMLTMGPEMTAWISPIDQIDAVVQQAIAAAAAAEDARANTAAAGRAAEAAGQAAGETSAEAQAAFAAAGRAQASAERARRATEETVRQANIAKDAARRARDAATRAVSYAEASARAAASAADHAGGAVNAAELATEHANNAFRAAEDALDAAELAQTVYTEARAADAERLQNEYELERSLAQHLSAKAAEVGLEDARGFDVPMREYHEPRVDALIAEAVDSTVDPAVAVRKAREVARYFAAVPATWTSSAAVAALGEEDEFLVLEFVRTGLAAAEEQDDRTTLIGLMVTGTEAMRVAAQAALDGEWADVVAFLDDPDYPERGTEQRVEVGRIHAEARSAGYPQTEDAANAALRSADPDALGTFLATTHDTVRAIDVRAKVGAIAGNDAYGTEVRNGARVALAGTTAMQVEFLEVERHRAAQRDQATATHDYIATSLMIETAQIAQRAVDLARTAQSAAAEARGAAEAALGYAEDAEEARLRAGAYAVQAVGHARDAAASAERAAEAVRVAAAATQQAQLSAREASLSARWARGLAVAAAQDAASAFAAYDTAYAAQLRAGKSASEAARLALQLFEEHQDQAEYLLGQLTETWKATCKGAPRAGEATFNDCSAWADALLSDPDQPFHDLAGYASKNVEHCRSQFVGKSLEACLSIVLSPYFHAAARGIAERETETYRLADEYMLLTGADLFSAASEFSRIKDCRGAGVAGLGDVAESFSECVTGVIDLSDPDWNEYARQWRGTFNPGQVDEYLRFAQYNSVWGPMYLRENKYDDLIVGAIRETELMTSLLRIQPIGCAQPGGQCPYDGLADRLRDLSESIKPENHQGYLVDESGRALDANGLPIASVPPVDDLEAWARYTVESGLHDDLAALEDRIAMLFRQSFGAPLPVPAWHLETQLAYRVATREVALRENTLRLVMNNPGGACDAVPEPATRPDAQRDVVAGCVQAIQLLLPAGTTMIIYYPDPENPGELLQVTVRGVGRWLD
ncbi:DddA-like double-stranded DNA deaminase toxin [Jiangella muralis]|uniref:DddA-like double-stranded DNA deaminase toxin n=1 Tax=Jiangella muralis TaxID=702383 RepID=UPI00147058C8|nr:DddA-like double-stranded DNA deaminase toxin [Jiangella muralis]